MLQTSHDQGMPHRKAAQAAHHGSQKRSKSGCERYYAAETKLYVVAYLSLKILAKLLGMLTCDVHA